MKRDLGFNGKRARFVQEYLKDLNATQAAIRAGYSAKTAHVQGPRLLGNVRVAQAIARAKEKRAQRVEVTQDEVVRELRAVAFDAEKTAVKVRALELLGKHLGMFTEIIRHEGDLPAMIVRREPDE